MELTFYWYPKCSTCKAAKKQLETSASLTLVDIKETPPTKENILKWMNQGDFTIKNFFNTSGLSYRTLGMKDKIDQLTKEEAAALLETDGMLIKRPLLLDATGRLVRIGYKEESYKEVLANE